MGRDGTNILGHLSGLSSVETCNDPTTVLTKASFKAASDFLVMSVLNSPRGTCTCAQCGGERDPDASVKGSYCSQECHEEHRREKAVNNVLNTIQYDHRFCFTCFRQLKEIDHPPSRAPECAIGVQYLTEHAEIGEKSSLRFETLRQDGPSPDQVRTGTICKCGATTHSDCIDLFRQLDEQHYVRFAEAVNILVNEGKLKRDVIDGEAYADAVPQDSLREAVESSVVIE